MNYKNIVLAFILFLTVSVSAVAGNPVTNGPAPEYSEDFYDHSEFELCLM
ncbi:hypothetical protein [Segatella albensis]|nr:hypothetical protein [Segatella albensis]